MLNILQVPPRILGIPKYPLARAAEQLLQVARTAKASAAAELAKPHNRIRNTYISRVLPSAVHPLRETLDQFKNAIKTEIARKHGSLKGPSINAINELGDLAKRAEKGGYIFGNKLVHTAFANFLRSRTKRNSFTQTLLLKP